jgi:alpha-beta hydrolase superfamily lysophospholipase
MIGAEMDGLTFRNADAVDVFYVLFRHSIGSVVVQAFVEQQGDDVDGYVLSRKLGPTNGAAEIAAGIRPAVDAGMAKEPLHMLGGLNTESEPARTNYDWLTRDFDEVDGTSLIRSAATTCH